MPRVVFGPPYTHLRTYLYTHGHKARERERAGRAGRQTEELRYWSFLVPPPS